MNDAVEPIAVNIPSLGEPDATGELIEIAVTVGDQVAEGDLLLVLESEKASLEIPAPVSGTLSSLNVQLGDRLGAGQRIAEIVPAEAVSDTAVPDAPAAESAEPAEAEDPGPQAEPAKAENGKGAPVAVEIPSLGEPDATAELTEVAVAVGERVAAGDLLLVLESEKASLEVPAPVAGELISLKVQPGAQLSSGQCVAEIAPDEAPAVSAPAAAPATTAKPAAEPPRPPAAAKGHGAARPIRSTAAAAGLYAGPAVRKLAREFGIDMSAVRGSGTRGRILREDLHSYVANRLAQPSGGGLPSLPEVDFSRFGTVRNEAMSGLERAVAANMRRSWLNVPHVTQFDDIEVDALEQLRAELRKQAEQRGVKLTPIPFLLRACAAALLEHPKIGASLHHDGKQIVYKQSVHIGIAVDTPRGLMVPVLRDVDRKDVWTLAAEAAELAERARARKLRPADMQGGGFTVSSLGAIGGRGFTPIINAPELAILGVSRLAVRPLYRDGSFVPCKMLPVSLSYDHRAVNGADAGRFMATLAERVASPQALVEPESRA